MLDNQKPRLCGRAFRADTPYQGACHDPKNLIGADG
jgi:hypothetical protein